MTSVFGPGKHMGRGRTGGAEDDCPCPQKPCGLVNENSVSPRCPEHPWVANKQMWQIHSADDCPGA